MNLDRAIEKLGTIVAQAIAARLQASRAQRPHHPKSAAEMRCRHEWHGKRCDARSRGPRFHYLCAEHGR